MLLSFVIEHREIKTNGKGMGKLSMLYNYADEAIHIITEKVISEEVVTDEPVVVLEGEAHPEPPVITNHFWCGKAHKHNDCYHTCILPLLAI